MHGIFISKSDGDTNNSGFVLLTLNSDSTFKLKEGWLETISECTGRWEFVKKRAIQLYCTPDTSVLAHISAGYMSERKRLLIDSNKKELILGKSLLIKAAQ